MKFSWPSIFCQSVEFCHRPGFYCSKREKTPMARLALKALKSSVAFEGLVLVQQQPVYFIRLSVKKVKENTKGKGVFLY